MHIVKSTRMNRNLKKLAGCGERPAIQYVLKKKSRVRLSTSKLWPKHANIRYPHGSHDNSGNYAERDDVENEADEQPRCWANKGARED